MTHEHDDILGYIADMAAPADGPDLTVDEEAVKGKVDDVAKHPLLPTAGAFLYTLPVHAKSI